MDILLAPLLGCAGTGFVLFFIQTILVLLPRRWPARLFPFYILVLWIGSMAWGIHNNPSGYILILFPGLLIALFGMLGLYLGYRAVVFLQRAKNNTPEARRRGGLWPPEDTTTALNGRPQAAPTETECKR